MGGSTARGDEEARWDAAYRDGGVAGVSWYQPTPKVSVELIRRLEIPRNAAIIDIGGGASSLVDTLLADGFTDLSVLDFSEVALNAVRQRLGSDVPVALIHGDLLTWQPERRFDLWHDRAVFHFLVEEGARTTYLETLRQALNAGGSVIMATFAPDGPEYCSGLPVARYSADDLAEVLGAEFEVIEQSREEHVTPGGVVQSFIWLAARRR